MRAYRVDAKAEGRPVSFGCIVDPNGLIIRSAVRFARGATFKCLQEWCLYGGHRLTEIVITTDVAGKPVLREVPCALGR